MATQDNPINPIPLTPLVHPDCVKKTRLRSAIALKDDNKDKPKIPGAKGFMFDMIVVRLDVPNKTITDPNNMKVDVNFNGKDLSISSSRINVLDFKVGSSFEFLENPLNLKQQLANNPLRLKVAEAGVVLGYGSIEWPEQFLLDLIESAGEMTFTEETELKECDGTKTGTIQLIVRLQPKCEEYDEDNSPAAKCRNANKEIHPTDILFVVGEDKNPCCCSQVGIIPATESDQLLNPNCLDLSNYRAVNSQTVNDTNILSTLDPTCQGLKTVKNNYQQLIDAVMGKRKPKCLNQNDLIKNVPPLADCDRKTSCTSSDSYNKLLCPDESEKGIFTATNIIHIPHKETLPNLVEQVPKTSRYCPLCKENISFLPKLAACPNCCYKPVPYFEEKPYNVEQTADQIVNESSDTNPSSDLNTEPVPQSDLNIDPVPLIPRRCTCQIGTVKPCTHCRIKRLCADVYQPPTEPSQDDNCNLKSSDANCTSSQDDRPYLTRIFSELKDLYDIKEVKRKEFKPDKRCEKELNRELPSLTKSKRKSIDKTVQSEDEQPEKYQPEIRKPKKCRTRRSTKYKAVKSRLYDYKTFRLNHAARMGHKTCINGFAGRYNVPPNMGWLWNVNKSSHHAKWKPGAIRKPIKELMSYFLKDFPADTILVSQYAYRRNSKNIDQNSPPPLVQKPTLHISKKNGEYLITMRPLKEAEILKESADPYENMKPVQFRITKNPQMVEMRKLKKCLKDMGFNKCTCHKPIIYCFCRSFLDKKKLEYLCNRECQRRNIPSCMETLVLSDTSESEEEFEFGVTPPAGVIKPKRLHKPNLVNVETQYEEKDWNPMPLYPKAPNKYMQLNKCAVGERLSRSKKKMEASVNSVVSAKKVNSAPSPKDVGGVKGSFGSNKTTVGFAVKGGMGKGGTDLSGKHGGRKPDIPVPRAQSPRNRVAAAKNSVQKDEIGDRKVDMMKYTIYANKKFKLSPAEAAAKRKEKMRLLKGVNPPLLCTVDRLGKPVNPCAPCYPCSDNRIC